MRLGSMVVVFVAGCTFNVGGTTVGGAGPGASPSPTQSVPDGADAGSAPPSSTPPPSGSADLGPPLERVGTACTSDAQCDPGLVCAKTFGAGPNAIVIPGGYCTRDCSASACPTDSICVTFSFGRYCSSSCPPDPCRTGYVCCSEGMGQRACTTTALCAE